MTNPDILKLPPTPRLQTIFSQVRLVVPRDEHGIDRPEGLALILYIATEHYGLLPHIFSGHFSDDVAGAAQAIAAIKVDIAQGKIQTLYRLRACEFFLNTWRP